MNKNVVPCACKQCFFCIKKQYKKCLDQEIKEEVYMICVHLDQKIKEEVYMIWVHLDLGRRKLLNAHMNVIHFWPTKQAVTVNSAMITKLLNYRQLKRKRSSALGNPSLPSNLSKVITRREWKESICVIHLLIFQYFGHLLSFSSTQWQEIKLFPLMVKPGLKEWRNWWMTWKKLNLVQEERPYRNLIRQLGSRVGLMKLSMSKFLHCKL